MSGMTTAEKIATATSLKSEGNELLGKGEVRKAITKYRTVFAYVNGLLSSSDSLAQYQTKSSDLLTNPQAQEIADLKKSVYLNLSLAYLKIDKPDKALETADQALALDQSNVKATFRRGQALLKLKRFEEAKASLLEATKQSPQDKSIRAELARWKTEYLAWSAQQKEKEKLMFQGTL